ncbi:hypothetical protein NAEGRDRAFT_80255 [Naegleria gruberi]|uniref:Uncharacterized protein n=1 Tax=Naegleria gruberi TaxID=5762 RepID=D2VK28_NAEGR|nr:uncharacterized protein NAEGRDRAFT_80255 [Naegleria gruberi]EFC42788.1 hypothetical protein NAEGRDRAFT_80255 [Naegleria gruberi]|eukprot:XP_002675532.1 hypothetical protein NAEGRDRAFT_80255 [Naegleria gruberi strain NEG-M]
MTTTNNAGWYLMKHFRGLASRKGAYVPPLIYKCMLKVPPPVKYGIPTEFGKLKELSFPDDALKGKIEKKSKHKKQLMKSGFTPLPFWFTRKLRDNAVSRVRELMEQGMTEEDAIQRWDEEFSREIQIQQRECNLLSEAALKNNEVLSVQDTLNILKTIRDTQKEHDIRQGRKLRKIVAKLEIERRKLLGLDIEESLLREAEHEAEVSFDKLLDVKQVSQRNAIKIENRVNQTVLRKIAQAIEIEKIVIEIRELKRQYGPQNAALSEGEHISPFDFIGAYVKSFDVNKIGATSAEWGKDREIYKAYIDGKKVHDILKEKYELLKEKFSRFVRLKEIRTDLSKFLTSIDVMNTKTEIDMNAPLAKYSKRPNSEDDLEKLLTNLNIESMDLTPVMDELKQFGWQGMSKMKEDQAKMEEMFLMLELGCYIYNSGIVGAYSPKYVLKKENNTTDLISYLKK